MFNVFNQNAQAYGYFGQQLPHAVNQYAVQYANPIAQYLAYGGTTDEEMGLQSRLMSLTVSLHF